MMTYHGQLSEVRIFFIAFIFKTSQKITIEQDYGTQFKLESFLNKYLILNPNVETYEWFLAKCYNE